jgi:hypothetical protein
LSVVICHLSVVATVAEINLQMTNDNGPLTKTKASSNKKRLREGITMSVFLSSSRSGDQRSADASRS